MHKRQLSTDRGASALSSPAPILWIWQARNVLAGIAHRAVVVLLPGLVGPVVGVSAIIVDGNLVLAVLRSDGLGFCLPGGMMRVDETLEQALQREVREETGLSVESSILFGNYSGPDRDRRFLGSVNAIYIVRVASGAASNSIEGDVRWLDLSRLPPMAFHHDEVLHEYMDRRSVRHNVIVIEPYPGPPVEDSRDQAA